MTLPTAPQHIEALIPALPEPLRRVPEDRARWEAWRDAMLDYRALIHRQCETDEAFRNDVRTFCANDPAYFLNVFGYLWEPRSITGHPAGKIPFLMFPYQVKVIRWLEARQSDDEHPDGFLPKPRGLGMSWSVCGWIDHGWLFKSPWDFGVASRVYDYVDKPGFKKSLFYKMDFIIDNLPQWLRPKGYTIERGGNNPNRADAKMINPENGNTVTGEASTTDLFRGDRLTGGYVDEATTYEEFATAWDSLEGTTPHRYCSSTEKGVSDFNRMWTLAAGAAPESVFETHWWDNLYFDEEWYRKTRARYERQGRLPSFRQEYEKDPTAWSGELVYPMAQTLTTGVFPYVPRAGQLYCWIDPGIRDATAIHWLQFHAATGRYRLVETYENAGKTARFYASLLSNSPISGPEGFDYDDNDYMVMDFIATLTDPIIYVGDPYGRNRGGDGASTFYETLSKDAKELSDGRMPIHVVTSYAPDDRAYSTRRDALASMLPKIDFNDTPQVRITIQALKEQAYKVISAGRQVVNPSSEPVHGWGSHRVTAMEYGARHQNGGRNASKTSRAKTTRVGMNGKPVNAHRGGARTNRPAYAGWSN